MPELTIAIAHQKGGVGKSTSAALLAAEIAELQPDWTVLVEDLDRTDTSPNGGQAIP